MDPEQLSRIRKRAVRPVKLPEEQDGKAAANAHATEGDPERELQEYNDADDVAIGDERGAGVRGR